jgi:hypothetical protein
VSALRDQLALHPYEVSAGDFVRFRVDANDDVVAGIVRTASFGGAQDSDEFRRGLGEEEANTLRLFAMRRTVQGRRQASLGLVSEAMDGFALLPTLGDVPWESWLKAALFFARSCTGDLEIIGERFADVASVDASARCDVALESMTRVDTLSQCRIVEVTTNYGTGFLEMLVFRNAATIGLFGAPTRLGVNQIEYEPTTNLAQLAASMADRLDATNQVVTSPIGQDQLAATSFSLTVSGSYVSTAGCLSFIADGVNEKEAFTVFVAELFEDADTASLAAAASTTDGQAAVYDSRRLILFSPQPSFDEIVDDHEERVIDFEDFEVLARSALNDPASANWTPFS